MLKTDVRMCDGGWSCMSYADTMMLTTSERHYHLWWGEYGKALDNKLFLCLNNFCQDSISVENALYLDPRVAEAAAIGVPDKHLGEEVAAMVTLKPTYQGHVTEAKLIAQS